MFVTRARLLPIALFSAALAAAPAWSAPPPPTPGFFFARGSLGYATQSLSELNDAIHLNEANFRANGDDVSFESVPGAMLSGLEAGYRVTSSFSTALGLDYQQSSVEGTASGPSETIRRNTNLSLLNVSARLAWWPHGLKGLHVGAEGGMGFGAATESDRRRDPDDPTYIYDANGHWDANAFTAGAFAGYAHWFGPTLFLDLRAGYRHLDMKEMDGRLDATTGTIHGPYTDANGKPVAFDFSGGFVSLGLGVRLGGD